MDLISCLGGSFFIFRIKVSAIGKVKGLILGFSEAHLWVSHYAQKPVLHGYRRFRFTFSEKVKAKSSHAFLSRWPREIKK